MKFILSLTMILAASLSFASAPQTLADYDASNSYIVAWPTAIFSNISIPVKNVCVAGNTLKTVSPARYCSQSAVVEICTRGNHGTEECRSVMQGETPVQKPGQRFVWGCVAYTSKMFSTSMTYDASICTKWEKTEGPKNNTTWTCVEFGTEKRQYALNYDVSVTAMGNGHSSGRIEVARLPFTIPQCK